MMANYTMTINECLNNPLTPMFNFDYPFYVDDEEAKTKFEEKFMLYYWICEIGFETFARFQKALQARLTIKMPYYQQLYETELACQDINFLLNKDLRETFTREIDTENETTGTNSTQQTSTNESSLNQEGTSTNTHKESSISDGVSTSSLVDGYLTGASSDNGSNSTTGTSNSSDNLTSEGTLSHSENGKTVEKTDLLSQGNIGITSSAELLQKWREVLINIDEIIIEDCRDLFMRIY